MRPRGVLPAARDPFQTSLLPAEEQAAEEEPDEKPEEELATQQPEPEITPEMLGLKLTGTVISEQRRVARLNQRSFAEGQTIRVQRGGMGQEPLDFQLHRVLPQRVVLLRAKKEYILKMEQRGTQGDASVLVKSDEKAPGTL